VKNPQEQLNTIVEKRLSENWKSFRILYKLKHYDNCISIMCQELDQYIKLLYILKQPYDKKEHLINCSINSKKWDVLDQDIDLFAKGLTGWDLAIYEFRNVFNKLTINYNYLLRDPLNGINESDKESIFKYINEYHDSEFKRNYSLAELIPVLPMIFNRITDNIKCYFLERKLS
jgi:hypothetical protein